MRLLLLLIVLLGLPFGKHVSAGQTGDLRESIMNGHEPCFNFTSELKLFQMNCSVLEWGSTGYGANTHISLGPNEIFDGRGENEISTIDLSGASGFKGLFKINTLVTAFSEAPLIQNVHVRNGTTASESGFILQAGSQYFVVDHCSSTGKITNWGAGGICGYKCGRDYGEVRVSNPYSTGKVEGGDAGGIYGRHAGYNSGTVNVTQCYSTGDIEGGETGGICGQESAKKRGKLYISRSYSTGDILEEATYGGGIVGRDAAYTGGYVAIKECYSMGKVSPAYAGGISGFDTAGNMGEVHITDCYTRGNIDAPLAGGVTGRWTGGHASQTWQGDVYVTNAYASGVVSHSRAGGRGPCGYSYR